MHRRSWRRIRCRDAQRDPRCQRCRLLRFCCCYSRESGHLWQEARPQAIVLVRGMTWFFVLPHFGGEPKRTLQSSAPKGQSYADHHLEPNEADVSGRVSYLPERFIVKHDSGVHEAAVSPVEAGISVARTNASSFKRPDVHGGAPRAGYAVEVVGWSVIGGAGIGRGASLRQAEVESGRIDEQLVQGGGAD